MSSARCSTLAREQKVPTPTGSVFGRPHLACLRAGAHVDGRADHLRVWHSDRWGFSYGRFSEPRNEPRPGGNGSLALCCCQSFDVSTRSWPF